MPEHAPKNIGNLFSMSASEHCQEQMFDCHSQQKDHRIGLECDPQAVELDPPAWVTRRADACTVRPYHLARVRHEKWDERSEGGENEEADVGRVVDLVLTAPMIQNSCYSRADHAAGVEDTPEHSNHAAFLVLGCVAEHERALGRPKETGAEAEYGASTDDERARLWEFVEDEVGRDVERVTETAKSQGEPRAELVVDSPAW